MENTISSLPKAVRIFAAILGVVLLLLVVVVAGCGVLLWSSSKILCRNDVFQEVYSPNGEYKVEIFERNCGATTGYSTQLSILTASEDLPNSHGNIFTMDGHPDWTRVQVTWNANNSVTITYPEGYTVAIKESEFRNRSTLISIDYEVVSGE
jgi:hypothetical protein